MENTYYAQPYTMNAMGFCFQNIEEYKTKASQCRDAYGQVVEEFELHFVNSDALDGAVFEALSVNQATIEPFLSRLDEWDEQEKKNLVIAVGECGYEFDIASGAPDDFEIDIYEADSLRELAEQFVDEGLFGEVPKAFENYIDYSAIARDLRADYATTNIAGESYIYRMS